ncbi:hypothetical protein EDD86DRAFT_179979, partial [Gorgonomyces haynaldii]
KSMPVGHRNVIRPNDSVSLWNYTLSPGWKEEEAQVLCQAVIKFGIGNWSKVIESGCLPGKTNAQLNLQLQRMLGQQSTAEFQGLHIDPLVIGRMNALKQGPEIKRKGGFIVNTGSKMTKEEIKRRINENKKYEVDQAVYEKIELKRIAPQIIVEQKKLRLVRLYEQLGEIQDKIQK